MPCLNVMKFINNFVDKLITRLGSSNDSEIVTALLAAFKLVFIPIATLSDKKSTKEQKEYALKRDFLTESTALLGYIGVTKAVKNSLTAPVCAKYYKNQADKFVKNGMLDKNSRSYQILTNVDKKSLKNHAVKDISKNAAKNYSFEQKENIKNLENVIKTLPEKIQNPKELYLNTKKTISHLCVCVLALSVIPFATNKILQISNDLQNKKTGKNPKKPSTLLKTPDFNTFCSYNKRGLNVFNY